MAVGIFGAGSIGAYLGLRLSAGGHPVVMLGRARSVEQAPQMCALDLDGRVARATDALTVTAKAEDLGQTQVCLLTVKTKDLPQAAETLEAVLPDDAIVVALQNGLRSVSILKEAGLTKAVVPGMVTFNVVRKEQGDEIIYQKATSGPVMAGAAEHAQLRALVTSFAQVGEVFALRTDIEAIQAGKLLLNLNNGLCAVLNCSIAQLVSTPIGRGCLADCIGEGRRVFAKAGRPARAIGLLSPPLVERALRLPDWIFFRVAKKMITIDPQAKPSTLVDLLAGRRTEIDALNGEIARLGQAHGCPAPKNSFVTARVHQLEDGEESFLSFAELRAAFDGL